VVLVLVAGPVLCDSFLFASKETRAMVLLRFDRGGGGGLSPDLWAFISEFVSDPRAALPAVAAGGASMARWRVHSEPLARRLVRPFVYESDAGTRLVCDRPGHRIQFMTRFPLPVAAQLEFTVTCRGDEGEWRRPVVVASFKTSVLSVIQAQPLLHQECLGDFLKFAERDYRLLWHPRPPDERPQSTWPVSFDYTVSTLFGVWGGTFQMTLWRVGIQDSTGEDDE